MTSSSHDFVLLDGVTGRKVYSNNEHQSDFVVVHQSPLTKRRELRASKELTVEEEASLASLVKRLERREREEEDAIAALLPPTNVPPVSLPSNIRKASPLHVDNMQAASPGKVQPSSPTGVEAFFGDMLGTSLTGKKDLLGDIL